MSIQRAFLKSLILWIFIFFPRISYSQENLVGYILKFTGKVYIKKENSIKPVKVQKLNTPIFVRDCIKTKSHSKAFIKFVDGSKVILEEKTTLCVENYKTNKLGKGKVFFKIRKGVKGRKLIVSNILIGAKGTKFAVVSQDQNIIAVKEGEIEVKNLTGEFKKFEKGWLQEFENFKKQRLSEFEQYKTRLKREFYKFVKSFCLKSGEAVVITGNQVKYTKISPEIEKGFKELDTF